MGPGIGLSVARRFAEQGFSIAMISRNEERLQAYAKIPDEYGTRIYYAMADAGKTYELMKVLNQFSDETSVLVYNAAVERSLPNIDP